MANVSGGGSQTALREQNTAAITAALTSGGPQLQAGLARATGLSRATVSNIVGDEVAAGRFRTEKTMQNGRWGTLVTLADNEQYVIGIDIGRTHIRLTASDAAHRLFGLREIALELGHLPPDTFARARQLVDELVVEAGLAREQISRIGIAVPASINRDGYVVQQTVLDEWSGIDIAALAAEKLQVDVVVDNDANLGAYALAAGNQEGTLVYIKVASGIGAGIAIRDRLYHSMSGLVGEVGHMPVGEGGQTCYCGSRGCLETLASTRSIASAYARILGAPATVEDVAAAVMDGNPAAVRIVTEAGDALGRILASICHLLSPCKIVIGGPLSAAGTVLIDAAVAAVRFRVQPSALKSTVFTSSPLGERTEMVGACLAAHNPPEGAALAYYAPVTDD
ncbi:MAG: ROK family protein [Promicromonosporaceae bacterium]|nr:ROK family protein [Promicromonosporaceae bacterium]